MIQRLIVWSTPPPWPPLSTRRSWIKRLIESPFSLSLSLNNENIFDRIYLFISECDYIRPRINRKTTNFASSKICPVRHCDYTAEPCTNHLSYNAKLLNIFPSQAQKPKRYKSLKIFRHEIRIMWQFFVCVELPPNWNGVDENHSGTSETTAGNGYPNAWRHLLVEKIKSKMWQKVCNVLTHLVRAAPCKTHCLTWKHQLRSLAHRYCYDLIVSCLFADFQHFSHLCFDVCV